MTRSTPEFGTQGLRRRPCSRYQTGEREGNTMRTYTFAYITRREGRWHQEYTVIRENSRWKAYRAARSCMPKLRLALACWRAKW